MAPETTTYRMHLTPFLLAGTGPDPVLNYIRTGHIPCDPATRAHLRRAAEKASDWQTDDDVRAAGLELIQRLAVT